MEGLEGQSFDWNRSGTRDAYEVSRCFPPAPRRAIRPARRGESDPARVEMPGTLPDARCRRKPAGFREQARQLPSLVIANPESFASATTLSLTPCSACR